MKARQRTTLATLKRAYDFVTATPPTPTLVPVPAALPQLITHLEDAIAKAEAAASAQSSGAGKVTIAQRTALRRTLRTRYLIPIRHLARVLARTNPGLDNIVSVPPQGASEATLIAAAQATATNVAPYQTILIARGLAPDFLAQLNAAIVALQQAAEANLVATRQQLAATATLYAAILDGRDTMVAIGYVIQTACDNDPINGASTRATWASIQHAHRVSAAPLTIV